MVGTGRCGTSFVAKVLHETLGVSMGERFREPSDYNPDGYYEDLDFVEANQKLVRGDLKFIEWAACVVNLIENRQAKKIKWGFKDPKISELIGIYLQFFDNPKVIWCQRSKSLVVKSFLTRYRSTTETANAIYETRSMFLSRALLNRNPLKIDFGENRLSVEDVAKAIKAKWPRTFP